MSRHQHQSFSRAATASRSGARALATIIAGYLLLLNVMAAALLPPRSGNAELAEIRALFPGIEILCSSSPSPGGGADESVPAPIDVMHEIRCVFCLPLMTAALDAPLDVSFGRAFAEPADSIGPRRLPIAVETSPRWPTDAAPRAPPRVPRLA